MFCKKGVLKSFTNFTGKQPCQICKKETLTQVFPVNFAKFLRTLFYKEHFRWLLLLMQCCCSHSSSCCKSCFSLYPNTSIHLCVRAMTFYMLMIHVNSLVADFDTNRLLTLLRHYVCFQKKKK